MGRTVAGTTVLVTGASAGIGRACADRLAASGWTVVGASRRGIGADDGTSWEGIRMDVDDDGSVLDAVATVTRRLGRVDALVAAAGWGLAGPAEETPMVDVKAQFETNFFGVVRTVQAVLPTMRAHGGGRLVLIGSIGGQIGIPFQAFYSASKFALEGFAEAIAYEVAPFGIGVSLVDPGNTRTEFTSARRTTSQGTGVYAGALSKALTVMERDEQQGSDPAVVARAVARVLRASHPPRRRSVGRSVERLGTVAKRLMPYRFFEAAARSSLGVEPPGRSKGAARRT
jgi:NAD(P)-dependent dehydrogenase (short-subunit alcohol dehydrogenase family)